MMIGGHRRSVAVVVMCVAEALAVDSAAVLLMLVEDYQCGHAHLSAAVEVNVSVFMLSYSSSGPGQFSPSVRPHNPATGFQLRSATLVSAELFSHGTGTLQCL